MPSKQELSEFENEVLNAFDLGQSPMASIYILCARMGSPQQSSQNKLYVKVYRTLEKLIQKEKVWVLRGTRDPSVYLAKYRVKGFDREGVCEIPF